jgi:hypothetical protein
MRSQLARFRPALLPALLLALTLLYMMPFVRPSTGREALDGHDLVDQQYPLLSFIFDSVHDGRGLPLWNPYQFAGQSTVANPQSTLFYPPAWIALPTLGVPRGVGWLAALHLWLGAWGMALFVRRIGASVGGALIGGIVYAFSALMGAHLGAGHLNYVLCAAWLPWIAAAYLWSVQRGGSVRSALPGAAVMGLCILSGYPPLLYFALIWLAALWVYETYRGLPHPLTLPMSTPVPLRREGGASSSKIDSNSASPLQPARELGSGFWRTLRPLIVIVGVGAILGAALLIPAAQFTLRSTRTQGASLEFSNSYALPGGQLITLVFPNLFGHPHLDDQGYWGLPFYEEVTAYFGILPLVAILLALRAGARPYRTLLLILVMVGVVVSLGIDGGLFPALYWLLPGYSIFRVPSRALYFVVAGASGLVALFITDLQDVGAEARSQLLRPAIRWLLPLLGAGTVVTSLGFMAYFTAHSTDKDPPWRMLYSGNVIGVALVAIGLTWLALWLWRDGHSSSTRTAFVVTALVVLFDVWHISQPLITVSAIDVPPLWKALAHVAPASPDFRVMTVPNQIIWQAGAAYTRHLNASGYDPLVNDAYQRLLDASSYNPTSPVMALLGVRYVISNKPYEWSQLPGIELLSLLSQDGGWYIYEVRNPLPRAFITPQTLTLDDERARQQIASGAINPSMVAITDHDVGCPPGGAGEAVPARIVRYEPNVVELDADQPGLLVLTDSYDPNWIATLDGQTAELLRVDTALRGVCLSPGAHRVRFEYRPMGFYVGVALSMIGWSSLIIAGLLAWIQARHRQSI